MKPSLTPNTSQDQATIVPSATCIHHPRAGCAAHQKGRRSRGVSAYAKVTLMWAGPDELIKQKRAKNVPKD
jgi:hypothetical protein